MPVSRVVLIIMLTLVSVHPLTAQDMGVREVTASERAVIPLTTKIRYTTMIVLPVDDEILDVVCGDRDFWIIQTTAHIAHVKPAKEGASTNLNLITTSGAVYSFLLTEQKAGTTDLKVYVTADPAVARGPRKFYPAADVEALHAELTAARSLIDAARRQADETIAGFKQDYPVGLQFPYGPLKYERPFLVRSIWHDGASLTSAPTPRNSPRSMKSRMAPRRS